MRKHLKAGNLRVLFKKSFTKNKIMDDSTDGAFLPRVSMAVF